MHKLNRILLTGLVVAGLTACSDRLDVTNQQSADAARALARATDVEALIGGAFNTHFQAIWSTSSLEPAMECLGMENYSNLANFGMATRCATPRGPIPNGLNNPSATETYFDYLRLHRAARQAALGLYSVNQTSFTFLPADTARTNRAKAFANFAIGVALGQLAMAYDSGVAVDEDDDPSESSPPLPFVGYDSLARYAVARLDSALKYSANQGTNTIPTSWLVTPSALTVAQFRGLIRGYAARISSGVARTPAERGTGAGSLVNWTRVQADADSFIAAFPTDFTEVMDGNNWFVAWAHSQMYASNSANWHQIWGLVAGMSDSSQGYSAWLATAPDVRAPYTVLSPDLRWPQGATRTTQQADARANNLQYIENRASGNDWFGDPSGNSQYRHRRWFLVRTAGGIGNYTPMLTAEMNLLAAEAFYRQGTFAQAAVRIDRSRVTRAGLPPVVGSASVDGVSPVPGGTGCVPKIPAAPNYTSAVCGTLWEALKYEKRMETAFTVWGAWWFDGRGWGDLAAGTALSYPVPYQEMFVRQRVGYPLGGFGLPTGAPAGTYGW